MGSLTSWWRCSNCTKPLHKWHEWAVCGWITEKLRSILSRSQKVSLNSKALSLQVDRPTGSKAALLKIEAITPFFNLSVYDGFRKTLSECCLCSVCVPPLLTLFSFCSYSSAKTLWLTENIRPTEWFSVMRWSWLAFLCALYDRDAW